MRGVAGIAGKEDRRRAGRLQQTAAPERAAQIEQAALRPVLRRRDGYREAAERGLFPPIELDDATETQAFKRTLQPEARDDQRRMPPVELTEGRDVEMVVVAVADEHRVDVRQRLERDARRRH